MSENATVSAGQPDRGAPPPFDPDPELIDHLEGSEFWLKAYRRDAEKAHREAQEDKGRSRG
jgi:hypothetical protein